MEMRKSYVQRTKGISFSNFQKIMIKCILTTWGLGFSNWVTRENANKKKSVYFSHLLTYQMFTYRVFFSFLFFLCLFVRFFWMIFLVSNFFPLFPEQNVYSNWNNNTLTCLDVVFIYKKKKLCSSWKLSQSCRKIHFADCCCKKFFIRRAYGLKIFQQINGNWIRNTKTLICCTLWYAYIVFSPMCESVCVCVDNVRMCVHLLSLCG